MARSGALPRLRHFYRTAPLPCPYIPDRIERKIITEIGNPVPDGFYNDLSRGGFRRSHHLAYRPACPDCMACVPVRIDVRRFERSRSLRRMAQLNADMTVRALPARAAIEHFRLFTRYQRSRHADSDMAGMGFADYRAMVEETPVETVLLEFRDGDGALTGACLTDVLDDGLSAVYSFYEPDQPRRSLGSLMILALVEEAIHANLPYVYLGYWIAESRKMAYKIRFRPLEYLASDGWKRLSLPERSNSG